MNCPDLSAKMPAVAAGRGEWSAEERRHLASCPFCAEEWAVVQAASRVAPPRYVPDPARVSAQVLARLRSEQRSRRRLVRAGWITGAAAAAAALVLMVRGGTRLDLDGTGPVGPVATTEFQIPMVELDSLTPAQLEAVLETLENPLGSESTLDPASLQDLDTPELERVLRTMEG